MKNTDIIETADENFNEQKLPFRTKVEYGLGAFADAMMANIIWTLALPIYNEGLGVSAALLGLASAIPRIFDAFSDPLMGHISDNTRSRWGRRKPYIFIGAVLTGIMCAVVWMPPRVLSSNGLFLYFLIASILYFLFYTVFIIPFQALGFEIATTYNQRTRLMAYRGFFASLGSALLLPWAYKFCIIIGKDFLGKDEVVGARYVGIIFGLIMICFGIVPALLCKEKTTVQSQAKMKITDALKNTFSNKPFLIIASITFTFILGVFLAFPLQFHINLTYVCKGDKAQTSTLIGLLNTTIAVVGIASVPLISFVGTRLGKKKTLLAGAMLVLLAFLSSWFLFTPRMPYLQIVFGLLVSPGLSIMWIMLPAVVADACDVDELNTGLRREGMYGAVFTFSLKVGLAIVLLISGLAVDWAGYDPGIDIQPESVVTNLRIAFALVPACVAVLSIIFISMYPLTAERMQEVKQLLEKKRHEDGSGKVR